MQQRIFYLDNLKVFLIILVICHHTAITYGASGSWYYVEPVKSLVSSIVLTMFAAINQSYFMGLFFFISGFFTPASLDKKGALSFLTDRLIRLGVPLLLYAMVIDPIIMYFLRYQDKVTLGSFYLQRITSFDINIGPLWFAQAVILFSFGYVVWKYLNKNKVNVNLIQSLPRVKTILISALVMGITAFVVRLGIPVGEEVAGMQLGFFVSYIVLFISGILAFRYQWLDKLSGKKLRPWVLIAIVMALLLPVATLLGGESGDNFAGGFNIMALTYAVWEPFIALSLIMILLTYFKEKIDIQTPLLSFMSRNAFAAYVIHPPIIILTSVLLRDIPLYPLLKFGIVSAIATLLIFTIAGFLTKLPLLHRVF